MVEDTDTPVAGSGASGGGIGRRWSVRGRLLGIVLLGAVLAIAVGAAGLNGVRSVNAAQTDDIRITDAQLDLARSDAGVHAIDAAVLETLLARGGEAQLSVAETATELNQAVSGARAAFRAGLERGLPQKLQALLWSQWQRVEDYVARARSTVDAAAVDPLRTSDQLAAFDAASGRLETSQRLLTKHLDVGSSAAEARAARAEHAAQVEILAILAAAILSLIGLAFVLGRSIVRQLRGLSTTAAAITAGDLDARTTVIGPDEIGRVGAALNAMADSLRGLFTRLGDEARRDAFSSQLAEAFEVADTVPEAYEQVGRAMGAITTDLPMELLVADASNAHLEQVAVHPLAGAPGCAVQTPYGCLAVRRGSATVFETSEALNACPRLRDRPDGACSAACVPVTFMGRALGVLHVTGPEGAPPTPQQLVRLTALASQAGSTIGTVRATETTQLQATTDGLTGLNNRRSLDNALHALLESGRPFAVAMADLDHFKMVNDTYGHQAGDRALRLFSQVLKTHVRSDDVLGRYGGEEFVIAFPGQTVAAARESLERLRAELAAAQTEGDTPGFTASFGLTDSSIADTMDTILAHADAALATAKRDGRDRIVVGIPPEPAPSESGPVRAVTSLDA
jgi:diguanylate cyclase (GGDEF)-like protein